MEQVTGSPEPDPSQQRREETQVDGGVASYFVARGGTPLDPEEHPQRRRGITKQTTRHGPRVQYDDGLDDVLPPEQQVPQYEEVDDDELERRRQVNQTGAALARQSMAVVSYGSLVEQVTDEHGIIDGIQLAALVRKRSDETSKRNMTA